MLLNSRLFIFKTAFRRCSSKQFIIVRSPKKYIPMISPNTTNRLCLQTKRQLWNCRWTKSRNPPQLTVTWKGTEIELLIQMVLPQIIWKISDSLTLPRKIVTYRLTLFSTLPIDTRIFTINTFVDKSNNILLRPCCNAGCAY